MSSTSLVRGGEVPTSGKTNERPGTRAVARHIRMSASKARAVLDLIRNKDVQSADEILRFSERDAAIVIRKVLASAVANAEHNDDQIPEDLYVAACFADEGKTMRRMRPRARGRASRIRKRSCHITVIVARMPERELERRRSIEAARPGSRAARRAGQQQAEGRRRQLRRARQEALAPEHDHDHDGHDHDGHDHDHDDVAIEVDQVTADDIEALAETEEILRDEPLTDAEVIEDETAGTQQAETLADHEGDAEVTMAEDDRETK
ncbi:MAG: 50S ribosomal protein L22 [Acidobacteria bacterium]|nr:50S ribosomal protein L22 [Acidobacteriota bacterium]